MPQPVRRHRRLNAGPRRRSLHGAEDGALSELPPPLPLANTAPASPSRRG